MSQPDEVARLVEAVSGLEQAVTGIAAILEGHGEMLARLLAAGQALTEGALRSLDLLSSWQRPEDGRSSICLRMQYSDAARALTTSGALQLHEHARTALQSAVPGLTLRTK